MKHISELTHPQHTQQQSETPSINYTDEAKQNIKEIFMLMKANYGHKWTSNLKEDGELKIAARLWLYHFHWYSKDILHEALSFCFLRYDWPPTVKEFREQVRLVQVQEKTRQLLALPAPPREPGLSTIAQEHLEKLKALVGLS